jgi:hypothetical protein
LCITPAIGSEIYKAFEAFRELFRTPAPRKVREQAPRPEPAKKPENVHQTAYEPTKAIACNDADHRRWVRVKEWYNDYAAAEDITSEKEKGHIIELLKSR